MKKILALAMLLASSTLAFGQATHDYNPPALGASREIQRQDLDLEYDGINADKQNVDSDLTAIAALTTTAFGRGLLDDADAAAVRASIGAGVGDVVGPGSATDNAVTRYDGTTGKLLQDSTAILGDDGSLTLAGDLDATMGTLTADDPFTFTQTWNNAAVLFHGVDINMLTTAYTTGSYLFRALEDSVEKFGVVAGTAGDTIVNVTGAAAGAGPRIQVQITGDTAARVSFHVDPTLGPGFGLGPGSAARDWFLNRDTTNSVAITGATASPILGLDDQGYLRFREEDAGGNNYKGFRAPAAVTADTTCTFEDDANFIPDSCVGDGTDGGLLAADIDTSAELRAILTDELGTGGLMFGLISTMSDDLACTGSQVVRRNSGDTAFECATLAGGGDVVGPASAVDNALARFDTTTGKLIQDSDAKLDDTGFLQLSDAAGSGMEIDRGTANANAAYLQFAKTRNASPTSHTVVADGDNLGSVNFLGSDGTNFESAAAIRSFVEGTPGANDMPGNLVFYTTPDGSNVLKERMRITAGVPGEIKLSDDDAGANSGPFFSLERNSASPAANDYLGEWRFRGKDSGANTTTYGTFDARITDPTDASEDMRWEAWGVKAGTLVQMAQLEGHNAYLYKDDGANPGQVVAEHWIKLSSTNTLTSTTAAQALFDGGGGPTNGRLTLDTGVYWFHCRIIITSMSATSGNGAWQISGAGTATIGSAQYRVTGIDQTSPTTFVAHVSGGSTVANQAAGGNMLTAAVGTGLFADIEGVFDVTAAGTIIPSIALTTAAAAVVSTDSFCRFSRGGDTGTVSIGAWD